MKKEGDITALEYSGILKGTDREGTDREMTKIFVGLNFRPYKNLG